MTHQYILNLGTGLMLMVLQTKGSRGGGGVKLAFEAKKGLLFQLRLLTTGIFKAQVCKISKPVEARKE